MRRYNKEDLFRYEGDRCNSLKTQLRYLLFTPGFQYSYCLRHAQHAKNGITRFWWRFILRRMMFRTGIQIPVGTQIGPGLKIGHFGTIVINPSVRIGRNFNISQGCLIGNAQGKKKGVPYEYLLYRQLCFHQRRRTGCSAFNEVSRGGMSG